MPIFEYRCGQCGREFEELVFKDDTAVPCPQCGGTQTEKLMSCCRFKTGPRPFPYKDQAIPAPAPGPSSRSACASCSGGSCATCK
ncbi:MAG: zinc ribbon domain-containing protein [Desulfovibrio sp.]|nr:zinc ribbon domain-containing protein [Desulfovibrio sp.]MCA1986355.1 zinc ribbon domain-containing protein [Desulfovibrio sp.]